MQRSTGIVSLLLIKTAFWHLQKILHKKKPHILTEHWQGGWSSPTCSDRLSRPTSQVNQQGRSNKTGKSRNEVREWEGDKPESGQGDEWRGVWVWQQWCLPNPNPFSGPSSLTDNFACTGPQRTVQALKAYHSSFTQRKLQGFPHPTFTHKMQHKPFWCGCIGRQVKDRIGFSLVLHVGRYLWKICISHN